MKTALKMFVALVAAGSASSATAIAGGIDPAKVSGKITFYTHFGSLERNGTWDRIEAEFKAKYPAVEDVEIISIGGNYEEAMAVRMSSGDYGDIANVPKGMTPTDYPSYFAPLNDLGLTGETYYFADSYTVDGNLYGLTYGVNAEAIVYNKEAFAKAGATPPKTLSEFWAVCEKLKAAGIVPFVTNMGSGWPMQQFDKLPVAISGDSHFHDGMLNDPTPYAADKPYGRSLGFVKTLIDKGWTEEDRTADTFQPSKGWMASGKAAMWYFGPWSINQIVAEGAAIEGVKDFTADKIGLFPLPYDDSGKSNVVIGPDNALGVSANSDNPDTAKAFVAFLLTESNMAETAGFIPGFKAKQPAMPQLAELSSFGPTYVEMNNPDPKFKEAAAEARIDFLTGTYLRDVLQAPDYAAAVTELNERWARAAERAK